MSLKVETEGCGPPLALLHGWGLNSSVWDSIVPALAREFTIMRIDLPGHGASSWPPEFRDLGSLARALASVLPARCSLLGWSLGGMAALELALTLSGRIERLVLVSTTPRFLRNSDWPHGLPADAVENFATLLEKDYEATVREFLGLQAKGDEHARATLRTLRQKLIAGGQPQLTALRAGLGILRTEDLRDRLPRVAVPTLIIAGEYDRMTPPGAARELAANIHGARLELIERAGHAPFLSHGAEFCRAITAFFGRSVRETGT
jgi:pimeloyl-[acyl-carrier protein] methyl ester esterase